MKRNQSIDSIKGVMILFVVAGHVGAPNGDKYIPIIQEWIYTFHMPAFFILSCLFIKSTQKELKSILPLLSCYVFWLVLHKKSPDVVAPAFIYSNWDSLRSVLWFLPAIISFKLMFSIQLTVVPVYWRTGVMLIIGLAVIYSHDTIQKIIITFHGD